MFCIPHWSHVSASLGSRANFSQHMLRRSWATPLCAKSEQKLVSRPLKNALKTRSNYLVNVSLVWRLASSSGNSCSCPNVPPQTRRTSDCARPTCPAPCRSTIPRDSRPNRGCRWALERGDKRTGIGLSLNSVLRLKYIYTMNSFTRTLFSSQCFGVSLLARQVDVFQVCNS